MGYQIYQFDDCYLPINNNRQEHTPGTVGSTLIDSIGGAVDYYGTDTRLPNKVRVSLEGWYVGEKAHEVDESGNRIVDESGNYIVTHGATTDLRVQVEALQQYIGKQGTLYRRWLDDTTVIHTKTARLLNAPFPQDYEDGCTVAEMEAVFETTQAAWRDDSTTTNSNTYSTQTRPILVHVDGPMRVDDAVIQIEASGAAITLVEITNTEAGISLRYAGTVADGNSAYINCETSRVLNNGVDDYANFSLDSAHTARCWLPLSPGNNLLMVRVVGSGTVYVRHRNQWP